MDERAEPRADPPRPDSLPASGGPDPKRRSTEDTKRRVEREAREHNPDPTTRREALEQELMDEDRSELGEHIGDEMR
jgi:hypothetical protein